MMVSVETYLRRGQRQISQWSAQPGIREMLQVLKYGVSGFVLSAASLGSSPQPLAMGLCCAAAGWRSVVVTLGSILGYRFFWDEAGLQGIVWAAMGGLLGLLLGKQKTAKDMPLLIPAISSFLVSATGLVFQLMWLEDTTFGIYALRIALAGVGPMLFSRRLERRDPLSRWLCSGIGVLALSQIAPVSWLSLGYVACGFAAVGRAFPGAVLAGLGLDLAQITPLPMTAALCCAYFLRLLPLRNPWLKYAAPGAAYLGIMVLWGKWDLTPLPGLVLGGALGELLSAGREGIPRQGQTGRAQVRLELTAGILAQTQQLLLEYSLPPIDEEALLEKVKLRACAACSARKSCLEQRELSLLHLRQPLEFSCRKTGRILGELRRAREQLYALRSDRQRQGEYRWALVQQYQFLSEYLRGLADQLQYRGSPAAPRYRVQVSARSRGKEVSNGDRCAAFHTGDCRCFLVLCDGMGTGLGAAREGQATLELLKKMLMAGFPPEHAFRSINSILALRGQAGAVTLDLAEVKLDTGKVTLYKWGAAPSWIISRRGAEKIGTATPPPGISVTDARETVLRLSLCRGEVLILLSDGAEAEDLLRREILCPEASTGELAAKLLELSRGKGEDDATVAVLRLQSLGTGTS